MRGAGAHKRGEVQGSRGLLPGSCVACGPGRGKGFHRHQPRRGGPAYCRGEPVYVEELRPAAEGSRPRLSLVILKEG